MQKIITLMPQKSTIVGTESFQKADGSFAEFEIHQLGDHEDNSENATFCFSAIETDKSKGDRFGYSFSAGSFVSPAYTMGLLRKKIKKVLAVKYLDREVGTPYPTHDSLLARISYCEEDGIVLEADGRKITKEEFWEMISSYEGWEIDMKINDQ